MPRASNRLLSLIPVLVALLAHANTIPGDFIFDDVVLIKEGRELHDFDLQRIFSKNYWGPDRTDRNYRPITLLSYALNWQISEGAWSFHVVNVLLNAGVALLAYWILVELLKDGWLAALGAALYTVLPIHTEAVANIVGRAELLAGLAILGVWLMALKNSTPVARWRERDGLALGAALLTFLGMLSKENVVVVVPLIILTSWVLRRPIPWKTVAGSTVAILVYLAFRARIVEDMKDGTSLVDNPLKFQDPLTRALNAVSLLGLYLSKTVLPIRLSADYAFNQIPVLGLGSPLLWRSAALAALPMAAVVWLFWKRAPLISLSVLFFWVTIAPASNILFWIGTMFGERLAYTPSFAYPLFLCACAQTKLLKNARAFALTCLCLLLLLYGARTWARNEDWADITIMNLRMSQDAPNSARSHFMAAVGHFELSRRAASLTEKEGEIKKAFEELNHTLEIDPTYGRVEAKRGEILFSQGKYLEAIEHLTVAGQILSGKNPPEVEPLILLLRGQCLLQIGKYSEAFQDFDDYIKLLAKRSSRPNGVAFNFRGLCVAGLGRLEAALKDFNTAAALRQDIPEIWNNRGLCRFKLKDYAGAIEDYKKGLAICQKEKIYQGEAAIFQRKIEEVFAEMAK